MITYSTSAGSSPAAFERLADGDRAELGRRVRGETAAEAPERRAHGGDDDGAIHSRQRTDGTCPGI